MPIAVTDPRWRELRGSYGAYDRIVALLSEAYQEGASKLRLGDLINEVTHQGDTSTAMYAVAPHLIELSKAAPPNEAMELLIHSGLIYAESTAPKAVACPEFLREEFAAYSSTGATALSVLLPLAKDFETFKWAVAAMAGFVGQHKFGRFLSGFELFQGRFYHNSLKEPFAYEE